MRYLHGIGGLIVLFLAFYVGRSSGSLFAWEAIYRIFNDQFELSEMILILSPFIGFCLGVGHILFGFILSKRNIWTSISLVLVYIAVIFAVLAPMVGGIGGLIVLSMTIPSTLVLSALFFIAGIIIALFKRSVENQRQP